MYTYSYSPLNSHVYGPLESFLLCKLQISQSASMSCPRVGRKQWFLQSFGSEQPAPKKTLSMTNGDVNLSGQGLACRLDNMATATGVETPLCLSYMAGNPAARNFVTFFPPESTHIAKQGAHGAMSFKDSIRCWK